MSDQLPEKSKGRKATIYRGAECLNCKNPLELSDVYCSYCGQLNTTKSLRLTDFLGEFIGSFITYDSKFRYTVKDLLFRPGVITRNYVNGQRLKYANPFRFFLSVSIIFFIVQGLISTFTGENNSFQDVNTTDEPNFEIDPTGDNINAVINNDTINFDSITQMNATRLDSILEKNNTPIQNELDSLIRKAITKDTVQTYEYISEEHLDTLNWGTRTAERFVLYYKFYKTTKIENPRVALDSLKHNNTKFNRWAYQKNEAFEQIQKNPTDFFNYLLEKTPFFVFFFTPFFALFFWLLYSKKKYTYMEHMIFIFHIFSFIFLAMLIILLPDTLIGSDIFAGILFLLIGPFYFYKALRNFYKESRIITIIKFLFLNFVFFISANIAAIIFFAITAAMY
ncbi:MAG: DUF3667 domain-containing protein [Flavobacteriaceae bacterium]|nr:DUF3667 domain-containing protein [Flavobacteriaceae bacterium]